MKKLGLFAIALLSAAPLSARDTPGPMGAAAMPPPRLIVAISIDQFSADLFAEYRQRFTGGFARLTDGVVFPSGYQSHAATETCPGHSTIMTGDRPARTGIIANTWIDYSSPLANKTIYCVEDETVPGSTPDEYQVSPAHLRVPTLGERMKAADPRTRTVSISGKDRAAVMMGGHAMDQIWWWKKDRYVSYVDRAEPAAVRTANADAAREIARAAPPIAEPSFCVSRDQAVPIGAGKTVGTGRFGHAAGDTKGYFYSPAQDVATLNLAAGLTRDMKLGRGAAPDVLTVSLSATDYIGHAYGTEGNEMCLNLLSLDRALGTFFATLDRSGVDYAVVLTADHGGHDLPERQRMHGVAQDQRVSPAIGGAGLSQRIAERFGIPSGAAFQVQDGNVYVVPAVPAAKKAAVLRAIRDALAADPQVAAVLTRDDMLSAPAPDTPPETWTLAQRARASFDPQRSGDLVIALKPRVVAVADPTHGTVTTHGSFWDYDRRVPVLFWRKGMAGFEQPLSVETVDIAPTVAGLLHFPIAAGEMDGRCLDLDPGAASTCPN